jgi:multidrug efflux system outer membrane protein
MSIFLCGCPRPSQYVRPALPVPSAWPESSAGPAAAPGTPAAADLKWQDFFTDQQLQSVIALALVNNRDLRVAALNIEKVQALYRIQRAEQYPTIVASASADGYRVPQNLSTTSSAETVAQYTVGLGAASWELDLFGRIRSLKSSALEQYLATEQARSAAQISLVAAVANTYLALAADRENLRLAQVTFDAQQASYELIRSTRDFGIASDLDLRQAQSQVEAARVDIARYSGQVALDENALNLLVGAPVAAGMLSDDLGKVGAMKDVAPGLPSDLLLRRPDILLAEHQLKAANANIGAARAAFFPRITLTAAAGITSSDLTNLFKPAAGTWNFAPQVALPIFDSGARQAGYRAAELDRDMAVAEYERAIQAAFREVSDALSLRTTLVAQQNAQQSLLNALEETYRLSEARYKGGIDSYLSVLVAQRSLYAAQQQLVGVRLARLSNLVTLYKVLGGGA